MTAVQDFPIPQGDDMDVTFALDPTDNISLANGPDIVFQVLESEFGVVVPLLPPLISKDTHGGGVAVLDPPSLGYVVHLQAADIAPLPPGNYYHQSVIFDANGQRATVCQGSMCVTQSLPP
jgi:hypothetical protein